MQYQDKSVAIYNVGYKVVRRRENFIDHDPAKPFITRGMAPDTKGCGAVDVNRFPKFLHFWLKSMMDARNPNYGPMVYVADYNLPENTQMNTVLTSKYHNRPGEWTIPWSCSNIMVFCNCDSVRLYQNGILMEEQFREINAATAPFIANKGGSPYFVFKPGLRQAGTLKAEGILDGKVVVTHVVTTPDQPARIMVESLQMNLPWVAEGSDLMPVYFKIVDQNGTLVPTADNAIHISVTGEGQLVGAGIPRIGVEDQNVEAGLGFAYVRATGKPGRVVIRAESQGLQYGEAELTTVPASCPFVPDGTHAAWSQDARLLEQLQEDPQPAEGAVAVLATRVPRESIESITASCPSADERGTDKLMDGITEFGTGWLADTGTLPQSITVKFKAPQPLSGVPA